MFAATFCCRRIRRSFQFLIPGGGEGGAGSKNLQFRASSTVSFPCQIGLPSLPGLEEGRGYRILMKGKALR